MIDVKRIRVVFGVVIAVVSVACSSVGVPTGSGEMATPTGPESPGPTPDAAHSISFLALALPDTYSRGEAEAVDGTTAVGWVQVGISDEEPAVWDTTTSVLRVLDVPEQFVHPSGETFVRLVGVSGSTAVGTGILGRNVRGQSRPMAWNLDTGDLRILDIPEDFAQAEVYAISGTTAIGQVTTAHGEVGGPVAWDTDTGAVRILEAPAGYEWVRPIAISGATIVGLRDDQDLAQPLVWDSVTAEARDLDLLPSTADGIPRAVDGTTAVGNCCFGEEGTPLPLAWDTATGAVRRLDLPAQFQYGTATGVSGSVVVGRADVAPLIWDLDTGVAFVPATPSGYEPTFALRAVSGRTIVGTVCLPPPTSAENPRCGPAAWTLP